MQVRQSDPEVASRVEEIVDELEVVQTGKLSLDTTAAKGNPEQPSGSGTTDSK